MPFILDDTEVNEPVYKDFVHSLRLRKRKRMALATRVRRLEAIIEQLQEQLSNYSSRLVAERKAKPYVRR